MSDEREPQSSIAPFGLRLQPLLKERVTLSAREHNRSINAEIVQRLEDSFMVEDSDLFYSNIREEMRDIENRMIEKIRAQNDGIRKELDELKKLIRASLNAPPKDY